MKRKRRSDVTKYPLILREYIVVSMLMIRKKKKRPFHSYSRLKGRRKPPKGPRSGKKEQNEVSSKHWWIVLNEGNVMFGRFGSYKAAKKFAAEMKAKKRLKHCYIQERVQAVRADK